MSSLILAAALLAPVSEPSFPERENVLLLVADDLGVDKLASYRAVAPVRTPNLDALAARGVLFLNAWANPLCSPTRATMLTGRYSLRTGVGKPIKQTDPGNGLSTAEVSLPEVLARGTGGAYTSALLGKWHLGTAADGPQHPLESGFDLHAGSLGNLPDFYAWTKVTDGTPAPVTTYATTDTTDDAVRAVRELPEPWLVWVAYNAPHKPFHAPPAALHDYALEGDPADSPIEHHAASVQALDTEIGRLLASLPPDRARRTTVVFLGDNGTHGTVTEPPYSSTSAKGSVFQGGVHVPLVVAGPRVAKPGSACAALVNTTDLFATVAELGGVDARAVVPPAVALDSVSLVPYLGDPARPSIRDFVYAEKFQFNGAPQTSYHRAIREARYKLIVIDDVGSGGPGQPAPGGGQLYDLWADPLEQQNLLSGPLTADEARAHARLTARLAALTGS